jgi:peptide/nickel transport system ATP-binding protein
LPTDRIAAAEAPAPSDRAVLNVENLSVAFLQQGKAVEVVRGISFNVRAGRTLCLVGESGCGKSVSMMAVLGLLNARRSRVRADAIDFEGSDLSDPTGKTLRQVRGRRIGMIFQDPMTSLNPTMPVGEQIAEVLRYHLGTNRQEARRRAVEMLDRVRIPKARERVNEYPFQFSGGMRQRVMIAMALACSPSLLIADEPTTALDVTVQAGIFDLLRELQRETGTALLLITHDLGVVAEMADEVAAMYAGRIVERSSANLLFELPQHPYTIGLFGATPEAALSRRLTPIPGRVPSPSDPLSGCRFAPRCPFVEEECRLEVPLLRNVAQGQQAACFRAPLEPLVQ